MKITFLLTCVVCMGLCIFDAEAQISRLDNRFKIKRSQPVRRVAPQTTTATRKTAPSSRFNAGRQDSSQAESGYITFEGLYNDETIQLPRWLWEEVKDINEQLREKLSPSDYLEILKGERALYGKYARKDAFMRELRGESGSNMTDISALREKLYKIYENPRDEKIFDSPHFVELPRKGILFNEHISYTNDNVRFADENYILSLGTGARYGEILSFWDSRTGRIVGKFSFPRIIPGDIVGSIVKGCPIYSVVENSGLVECPGSHWWGSDPVAYAIDLASRKFQSYGYTHEEIDKKIIAQPRGVFQELGVHFPPPLFHYGPPPQEEQPPYPWYITRNECLQDLTLTHRGKGREQHPAKKDTTTYADDDVFSIYDEGGNGYELEWGTLTYKNWDEEKGQAITRTREKVTQAIIEKVENKRDYDDWVVSNPQGNYALFAGGQFGPGSDDIHVMYGIRASDGLYLFPPLSTDGESEELAPVGKLARYRDCLEQDEAWKHDLPGGVRRNLMLQSREMALPVMRLYPENNKNDIILSIGMEGCTEWDATVNLITLNKLNHEYKIINKLPYRKSNLLSPQWMPEHRWFLKPETDFSYSIVRVDDFGDTRKIADFYVDNAQGYAIVLPNGHYVGSPGCEKFLQYGDGARVVGMWALAPWRNRPAEVLEAIGGNADDIAALRETTKRWLRKQGFDPDNMPQEPALAQFPVAEVKMPELFSKENTARFEVRLKASARDIKKLEVRVDGVLIPQQFDTGLCVTSGEEHTVTVDVPLASGQNWIEVTPIDDQGISGDTSRFRTIYKGSYPSDLFIVALGVSDYDDPDLKLQYAAKDAKDIAAAFEKYGTGRKHLLVLTDKEVKDKSVLEKVKIFLSAASLEDRIVFYVAGHGMLDDQLNYYYAPAGFNIDRISETGIPMDDLLACIQSSKARKRLLLLDTCHSGVLGEEGEEKLAMSGVQLPHGVRAIQHRGMKIKKAIGALNTKQKKRYIEDLFSRGDVQRGINIIAGAAGAEYALESGAWKNGVFTSTLIQALQDSNADTNKDGRLNIEELQNYVASKVAEQTNGAQKPSSVASENGYGFILCGKGIELPAVTHTDSPSNSSYSSAGQTHADLQPMIDRMAALRCREASSALYQKRLLTLLPMIRDGADVDVTLPETKGNTALHYACAIGSWSITKWLVEHGANVNAVTDKGSTPLDCVGEDNAERIRALLISRGAKKAAELNQGGAFPQSDAGGDAVPEDAESLNNLGLAYQFGNGKPKNYEEAARCFRRAAEQGHAGAQNNLGFLYHNGWGVPQDYSQAAYWYRLSAQQGNAWGQSNYGTCLEFGWGVKKDVNAAIEMYRRAASQGHASAKKHLKRHGISM